MELENVKNVLKEQLKNKGITYEEVAIHLGVSVPTIKRWLTKSEIPFSAVNKIINLLEISWSDFSSIVSSSTLSRKWLTRKQEEFLSKNPKMAYICLMLFKGNRAEDIKRHLRVEDNFLERSFLNLDKYGLIDYVSFNKIKVLTKGPFKYKASSPFAKKYFPAAAKLVFTHLFSSYFDASVVTDYRPGNDLFKFGEIFLSNRSFERFKLEIDEIVEKYQEVSRQESISKNNDNYIPRIYQVGAGSFNLWKSVMWGK